MLCDALSNFAAPFHFFVIMRLTASPFVVASQNGFITADLPSERGRDIKKHYLRYTDDPILTDTTDKQSVKLSSRIGKIKSWKPPKSFLPVAGALGRRRMSTSGSKRVSAAEKDPTMKENENERKIDSELHSKQNVRVSDDSKNKNWKQFLKVGFSALKSEIDEQQGTKTEQPADSTDSGSDNTPGEDRGSTMQARRISCNSAGSAVEW